MMQQQMIPLQQEDFSLIEKTILSRGPLLWLLGCSVWAGAVYWSTGGFSLVPPSTTIATGIATLFLWTFCCVLIIGKDVYDYIVENVWQPTFRAISTWSLDDVLRMMYDPQQLVAHMVQFTTLSVSLYSLPTTPEQRAQVFQQVGLLPPGEDAVGLFAAPGGWMRLLCWGATAPQQSLTSEEESMDESATLDGDDLHPPPSPYSISPIYRDTTTTTEQQQQQRKATTPTVQVQSTLLLRENPQETISALLGSIVYQQARRIAGPAALTICTILAARYSSRLRLLCTAAAMGAVVLNGEGTLIPRERRPPAWKGTLLVLLIWLFRRRGRSS